ncbi:hypothetical protein BDQ17DRAFT_1437141 [Cyathus striatus]|nr:hypothetical protein BDQ17DRAFT_1437141 [Cyathus striatus]
MSQVSLDPQQIIAPWDIKHESMNMGVIPHDLNIELAIAQISGPCLLQEQDEQYHLHTSMQQRFRAVSGGFHPQQQPSKRGVLTTFVMLHTAIAVNLLGDIQLQHMKLLL